MTDLLLGNLGLQRSKHWLSFAKLTFLLLLAVLALRYPFYAFLSDASHAQSLEPWQNSFKTWCQWDCNHYSRMSTKYTVDDVIFFPGFPWTVMFFRALIPGLTGNAGVLLVSNLFSLLALGLIGIFLSMVEYGERWKESWPWNFKIWLTLAIIAVFPNSHFWSSGYAESEQMTFFALIYLLLHQRRFLAASFFAGFAALVRIQCVWIATLFGALVVFDFVQQQGWFKLDRGRAIAGLSPATALKCLTLIALPFSIFMAWQWIERGDPLLFIHNMQTGGRPHDVLDLLKLHLPRWDLNYFLLLLSHYTAFKLIRRPGMHWKLMALVTWALALMPLAFGGFSWGYGRYMTCSLGIFIVLGEFLATRPWLALPYLGWSVFRLGVEVNGWTMGLWRG